MSVVLGLTAIYLAAQMFGALMGAVGILPAIVLVLVGLRGLTFVAERFNA